MIGPTLTLTTTILLSCQDKLWSWLNYFHWLWGGKH